MTTKTINEQIKLAQEALKQLKDLKDSTEVKAKIQNEDGKSLTVKVSPKGGVSIYGLGRFPVTLYKSQLIKLAKSMPSIIEFAKQNDDKLVSKASE